MTPAEFWAHALRTKATPIPINPKAARAFELCKEMTILQASSLLGVGREHVRRLRDMHRSYLKQEAARAQEVEGFLRGAIPFERLSIKVLGKLSVKLGNALHRMGILTVAQLMKVTRKEFLLQRGAGRTLFKELNSVLDSFGAEKLPHA